MIPTLWNIFASFSGKSVSLDGTTGRVIESVESMIIRDRHLREIVVNQTRIDAENNEYTPRIADEADVLFGEHTILGDVTFDKVIHRGGLSVVYTLKEHPNLLIKYAADCEVGNFPHPLIQEYHYMRKASEHGLSPDAVFLSPPSLLCGEKIGKCGFKSSNSFFTNCRDNEKKTLRYLIMEKHNGTSLFGFRRRMAISPEGQAGVSNAVILGIHMIHLIKKLHTEANIVHGDIHSPNIMVSFNEESRNITLQLIDFGRAFRRPDTFVMDAPTFGRTGPLNGLIHPLLTSWQMRSYPWAARDDILRAVQTIATLMQPFEYVDFEQRMTRNVTAIYEWKESKNWFISPFWDPIANIPDISVETKEKINEYLLAFLNMARSLRINDHIPYDPLISLLARVHELASTPAQASTNTTTTMSP